MPQKSQAAKLSDVAPTAAELAEAKRILQNSTVKRSKYGCLANFLKANPDEAAQMSKGEQRAMYLERFLVHQMRTKAGTSTATSSHSVSSSQKKGIQWTWISMEKMDTHHGPMKAQHWRDSKKLTRRPDCLTGSEKEEHKEWKVPEHWESMTEDDLTKLLVENSGEATQEDVDNLNSASFKNEGATGGAAVPEVKEENESELVKLQRKLEDLKKNPRTQFDKFTTMSIEAKTILTNAERSPTSTKMHAAALITDLTKHIPKVARISKLLEKMLTEAVDDEGLPKLLNQIDEAKEMHTTVLTWAGRFSLLDNVQAGKKSRKRKAN